MEKHWLVSRIRGEQRTVVREQAAYRQETRDHAQQLAWIKAQDSGGSWGVYELVTTYKADVINEDVDEV